MKIRWCFELPNKQKWIKISRRKKNLISADDNRNNYGKFGKDNEIIQAEKYGLSPSNSKFLFMYLILI